MFSKADLRELVKILSAHQFLAVKRKLRKFLKSFSFHTYQLKKKTDEIARKKEKLDLLCNEFEKKVDHILKIVSLP